MGGGRRLAGEFTDLYSDDENDASSSDESKITELSPPKRCDACFSAYARARSLLNLREFIRRYKPGDFVGDAARDKIEIPETTTLLLIGGTGKSALVSEIKSIFEHFWNPSTVDMAGVTDDLEEHMILENSTSICVFDTPEWSICLEENYKILQKWMKNGVFHGENNICDSINAKIKKYNKKRMVNYAILVLDAISILKSIDTQDTHYMDVAYATFNYPFLSFKGGKPAVVVINGDRVSSINLASVLNSIEDLLDIPRYQIFNISGIDNYHTELNVLHMLRYCLEKADRGLPLKKKSLKMKRGLEHPNWKVQKYLDLAIDVYIIYLCFMILAGIGGAMGLFSFGN
ncbi:P-loop containing nucleoside triphosphate hydrolases superfamily protein isoform X2 [Carex rostrata]